MGRLGLEHSLNVWLFLLSSHYFSLLCQSPWGIEVMGPRVFLVWPKTHLVLG